LTSMMGINRPGPVCRNSPPTAALPHGKEVEARVAAAKLNPNRNQTMMVYGNVVRAARSTGRSAQGSAAALSTRSRLSINITTQDRAERFHSEYSDA